MGADLLLIAHTALRRYAISNNDVHDIKLVTDPSDLTGLDARGRSYVRIELGPLLDPADHSTRVRRRALIVPTRRRLVALMVDYVESFEGQAQTSPLPSLIQKQLRRPWVNGAVVLDNEVIVQLDLRAIALSALASQPSNN